MVKMCEQRSKRESVKVSFLNKKCMCALLRAKCYDLISSKKGTSAGVRAVKIQILLVRILHTETEVACVNTINMSVEYKKKL